MVKKNSHIVVSWNKNIFQQYGWQKKKFMPKQNHPRPPNTLKVKCSAPNKSNYF